ncbi:MAG: phage tail sheath subtilisin-like domain-containing protein [Sulfitobacter sp.]
MVELLAPGVYTIETSFRARSIQGVGTSTTGFIGMARSGPVGGPPQLITSFAEFERIYGGLSDLDATGLGSAPKTNFAAHAVRAFFNEMGARLYFSRAFSPVADNRGGKAKVILKDAGVESFVIKARFPGAAGNGRLDVSEAVTPVTDEVLKNAPVGAMVRSRGKSESAASLQATARPAVIEPGAELKVEVDSGPEGTATLNAAPAIISWDLPAATIAIPAGASLIITVDGLRQIITLGGDGSDQSSNDIVNSIRAGLQRASISRAGQTVTITSAVSGSGVSMTLEANAVLAAPAVTQAGSGISRMDAVTASDLNAALVAGGVAGVRASSSGTDGRLILTSDTAGVNSKVDISNTDAGVLTALGFQQDSADGAAGADQVFFIRDSGAQVGWKKYTFNGGTTLWETDNTLQDPKAELGNDGYMVAVNFIYVNADGVLVSYETMSLVDGHPRYFLNRMKTLSDQDIANGAQEPVADPLMTEIPAAMNAVDVHAALFKDAPETGNGVKSTSHVMEKGSDGALPALADWDSALDELERYDDISIVAAPGSSAYSLVGAPVRGSLRTHAANNGFRIAVLDPPLGETLDSLRNTRGEIDSSYTAFYAPWIRIANPLARPGNESIPRELLVPPSGAVCGIYARNDQLRGVHKTPANEVIRSAIGFETDYNQAQQGVLNPLGINCLRTLKGRGHRIYGGRLATSDREVLYVSDRRYLNFIKRSLYESMQWAVFEPNGPDLWTNVREAVASFLYNQWFNGALFGATPGEAFFVICDRSVMTQADLDNGRMVCQVGLALLKPAEFVIFNIGQKTADMGI